MSTQHTPGPWTDKAIDESQWGVYDSRGFSVAQAHQIKVLSADIKQAERTANARLIAAAPDLLQELINIASAKPSTWEDPTEFKAWAQSRAQAAIAKALGEKND